MLSLSMLATWKEALNWFFKEAGKQTGVAAAVPAAKSCLTHASGTDATTPRWRSANVITDIPSLGTADLGRTPWERRLIEVLRSRHYRWRTELAYRQWACRWAEWLEQRNLRIENAEAKHVRDFLTELATRQRVSASTQKQALNALVFFLREALERDPGEFGDFVRAERSFRVPVVLSRDAFARSRLRPPHCSGTPWTGRRFRHPDLHARDEETRPRRPQPVGCDVDSGGLRLDAAMSYTRLDTGLRLWASSCHTVGRCRATALQNPDHGAAGAEILTEGAAPSAPPVERWRRRRVALRSWTRPGAVLEGRAPARPSRKLLLGNHSNRRHQFTGMVVEYEPGLLPKTVTPVV